MIPRSAISATLGVCMIAFVSASLGQTTYHVDALCGDDSWFGTSPTCKAPDGPKRTIQAGVDASRSGDTVVVASGVYRGVGNRDIKFRSKSLTVRSTDGSATCMIDCQASGRAFRLDDSAVDRHGGRANAFIVGFTIFNGIAAQGGGIFSSNYDLRISDCVVRQCNTACGTSACRGGGLYFQDGRLTIESSTFEVCQAGSLGGGIYIDAADVDIQNCTFVDNRADTGAGMSVSHSTGRISECSFEADIAEDNGGGIFVWEVTAFSMQRCQFHRNSARNSGGGIYSTDADPAILECEITNNTAEKGAGMALLGGSPDVRDCLIAENEADSGADSRGGGVFLNAEATLVSCTLRRNSTSREGGGLYLGGGNATFDNCAFEENRAEVRGGGLFDTGQSLVLRDCTPLGAAGLCHADRLSRQESPCSPCVEVA